jgi:competence protein ComQ
VVKEDTVKIAQVMLQVNHFSVQELKTYLSEFVAFKLKGNFPFGQLVSLHYQMFGGQLNDINQAAAAVELMIFSRHF